MAEPSKAAPQARAADRRPSPVYTDNLQVRVGEGVKPALSEVARRRGRKLSDELRAAVYAHLRRAGVVLPDDPYADAPPMPPEAITAIAQELQDLVEERRRVVEERGDTGTR